MDNILIGTTIAGQQRIKLGVLCIYVHLLWLSDILNDLETRRIAVAFKQDTQERLVNSAKLCS